MAVCLLSNVGFIVTLTSLSVLGLIGGSPSGKKDIGTFWQITDVHWDDHYSQSGDPKQMCHIVMNETRDFHNGMYGNFDCDSPWILINSAVQAMKQYEPNPDFIIWTGDNAPHVWNPAPDIKDIAHILSNVTRLLSNTFPNATILPVIGNHDTFPPDKVAPGKNPFYNKYLTSGNWNKILPHSTWDTFLNGGYYSVSLHPGLNLIGLNTILWYQVNTLTANSTDPSNQFSWFEKNLEQAKKNGEKVYIIGHVPPGHSCRGSPDKINPSLYHSSFNEKYISIINRYGDVVAGQFFAHLHYDTFGLFLENEKVKSSMLLAPSVTPWHSIYPHSKGISVSPNPSVRLYHYGRIDGEILNYEQYFLNLTSANNENRNESKLEITNDKNETSLEMDQTQWELLYSFTDAYNQSDVSTESLVNLLKQLLISNTTFDMYYNFTSAARDNGPCDNICHKMHLCAIANVDHLSYKKCIEAVSQPTETHNTVIPPELYTHAGIASATNKRVSDEENHLANAASGSSRNILIGCTLSLFVIIMILVVVYIKRARLAKGPRFVRFQ